MSRPLIPPPPPASNHRPAPTDRPQSPPGGSDENSATATPNSSGWRQPFLDRIRACEYPQFLLDSLPLLGATESVLRLDHVQPIGRHHDSYSATKYCLSDDAIDVVDEWLGWLNTGQLCEDAVLADIRTELLNATP